MPILTVGPGQTYATLSAAVAASLDGDVIQVQAVTYVNDFTSVSTDITIEAVGGRAHFVATAAPPNGKAIMVTKGNITLRNLEFSGAAVPDENGAGIRYESGHLTIDNSYFHDNQNGLLAAANATGTITITNSEFANNGIGDGETHNLYVNRIATLTVTDSYFHDVSVGHQIKSRADTTIIQRNTIADGPTGTGSYSIDVPNGGQVTISDNLIQQGPLTDNPAIIHFGGEAPEYPGSSLTVSNNVIRNDLASGSSVALSSQAAATASFLGNQVYGLTAAQIHGGTGPVSESGTIFLTVPPPIPCFLEGTRIATPCGEVPVEDLAVGDLVLTADGAAQPIVWIGRSRALATPGLRGPATPIVVRKGALAPNVPHADLRLTKGHSLHLDDALIPVECLVNHRSIAWDDMAREIQIFHVELARHAVLLANGAPAESYRDDANRWLFQHAGPRWHMPAGEPCAPVLTGGPLVDAVWRRLLDRAGPRPGLPTTEDPDLHLSVDGMRIDGNTRREGVQVFRLARRPVSVRLMSRSCVPSELGVARDERQLGVALRRVVVSSGGKMRSIDAADPSLTQGFHSFEAIHGFRWTDGEAMLPVTMFDGVDEAWELEAHVGCTSRYPLFADEKVQQQPRNRPSPIA